MIALIVEEILTLLISFKAIAVIAVAICTQSIVYLSFGAIPRMLALPVGLFMITPLCFFWIPMICILLVGVCGEPWSWPLLIMATIQAWWPNTGSFVSDTPVFLGKVVFNIYRALFPPIPIEAKPGATGLQWLLFQEPCMAYHPDKKQQDDNKYPEEVWIYINGVATTKEIADTNRDLLFKMFGRPIHLLHNPTNGFALDVFECVEGKTGLFEIGKKPIPRRQLKDLVRDKLELKDVKKVVLIAHSQGTIITGNTLVELGFEEETLKLMKEKLEVYNFADCAHEMPAHNVAYLENLSNEGDLVAYLGHLFPFPKLWITLSKQEDKNGYEGINITGKSVIEPRLWGHLLNSHYLIPMLLGRGKTFASSKLVTKYMKQGKFGGDVVTATK